MQLKTNLHFHTADDPEDFKIINYTFYEGIDEAAKLGFEVIALTCHNKFINSTDYKKYAENKGIFLIAGIEKNIEKRHVLILNADLAAETVDTFEKLTEYKKRRPDIFVLAAHPYFPTSYSLREKLEMNIRLFDAIEYSWFYSKRINYNRRSELTAKKYNLPLIAASDTHDLNLMNTNYALIDAEEKNEAAIFKAIRENKFQNTTSPRKFWREMIFQTTLKMNLKF